MAALPSFDLSTYVRIGRYDLPEPTRTGLPAGTPAWNLLAQEASAVTYNKDTDTLFVLGDGGTAIVQITKNGQLIDTMTLARGASPQGSEFYDPEGLSYVGNGKFVFVEERDRQVVEFTYQAGATLTRANAKTVKLGTTLGNIGLEGISFDPSTSAYVLAKEISPAGVFLTSIDFGLVPLGTTNAGGSPVASNGSATTVNSTNLFDPAKAGLADFADIYALSNSAAFAGTSFANDLLILSQESGKVVEIGRDGTVHSSLNLRLDPGSTLSIADQTHEGITMDAAGNIYIVSENGGGDVNHPQLWVYGASTAPNEAPTDIVFNNRVASILENIPITAPYKLADVAVVDDGLGSNLFSLSGPDAASFQVDATGLYLKTGTILDYETKSSYDVTVSVDDLTVGSTPDASRAFSLALVDVVNENAPIPALAITEVSPWSSGNSLYKADWFEITNTGFSTVDLAGIRYDDDSNAFGNSIALQGVSSLAPGRSAVFLETVDSEQATISQLTNAFKLDWFGANVPVGFQVGTYSGAGVGLSTGGDAVNLFDQFGRLITGVKVPASTTYRTFANGSGSGSSSFPTPTVSTLSTLGVNAFASAIAATGTTFEIGSPGVAVAPTYNFSAASYGVTEGTVAGALTNATVRVTRSGDTSAASSVVLNLGGGSAKGAAAAPAEGTSTGPSSSATPYVLPVAGSGVAMKSLLTVGDAIGGYKMAGIPDGLGAFDNGNGTFTLLMNHEIGSTSGVTRAHGGKGAFVSSWVINKSDLSVVSGSDLIQNVYGWDAVNQRSNTTPNNTANGNGINFNRFCSADLASPSAFYNASSGLGSQARIFLNGEEGGSNGYALANVASGGDKGNTYVLGRFNLSSNGSGLTGVGGWENLLANPFAQDKTVVIGNNDGGSGFLSQSLAVYVGTKTSSGSEADKAGLTNGVLKFVSVAGNSAEIADSITRATNIANGTRFSLSATASTAFSRPEDGLWDPNSPNKYYFVTTDRLDQAADGLGSQIGNTRLWRLNFDDITNPDLGGSIELLVDGDMVNGKKVNMFDNIMIDNYGHILLLEDVGGAAHNGKIYQYDIATDSLKLLAQHDPARFGDVNQAATAPFTNDEETSGIIDMESILGAGWSLVVDQAHYNTGIAADLVEGGQLLALFNPDTYKASQPDYINSAQTISFAAGETYRDVSIPVYGDTRLEGTETVNLNLSNPSAGSAIGATQSAAQLVITDPATYNFSAASYGVTEGTVAGALTNATVRVTRSGDTSAASSVVLNLGGGSAKGAAAAPAEGTSTGPSSSATPYVLPVAGSGVAMKSLLTVGDAIGGYKMAGIPDGLGAFDNGNGTFTLLMNHEIGSTSGVTRAHGGKGAFVSSWVINKSDLSVVSGSDLIQNVYGWDAVNQRSNTTPNNTANGNGINFNRFCSADLASPSAFYNASSGLGSQARIFLNGEEGGSNGYALANVASGGDKGNTYVLGRFNLSSNGSGLTGVGGWENLLANPFAQDKTVVIGNNDGGSGFLSQSLAVYVGTKTSSGSEADKAGLTNGVLKFVSVAGNSAEIADSITRATNIANGTRFSLSATASTAFSRPEDGLWDPNSPNKYYFVTTDRLDQAADGLGSQIGNTRLWRLNFDDITNPDLGGSIELLVDGDMVNGKKVNMFDNIMIDNYGHILLLEDVGGAAHNGKIYQYDIATDSLKLLAQHDPARFGDVNQAATAPFTNDEETSGIIDMESILGAGWSLVVDQAHYNTGIAADLVEGGQLLALFNPDTYKASQPDYINSAQTISFAAGETYRDVSIPVYGDTRLEGTETVNLNLSNPSAGSAIGATQSAAQLVIADINPTPTDIILNNSTVNENVSAAATVGGFSSVSPISGDNFTFNLVPGDGDQDNALFMVDGNQLKIKISPNYEAKSSYSIRVRTTQADGRSFEKIFIIGVNDQPESAEISGVATLGVKEGTGVNSNGQIVASGVLTVIDPDAGQSKFQTDVLSAAGNLGSLIINQSGVYAYTLSSSLPAVQALNAGQTKVDTFTVKSFDGSASKDISVTISGATAGFNAVAAGDPTSNGATLWTRTFDASDTSARKGLSQSLTLTIATDAAFANPVFSSFGSTSGVDHDSTIKINATGLSAGASYYYRFQTATGETSPVGFFKTAPLATSDVAVRFAHSGDADGNWRPYLSSQDFPSQKFDFFIFNGDTIYETASKDSPAAPTTPATEANPTAANLQALLAGYQRKYLENLLPASGGSYPGLQSLYSSQGVYVSLDNHELGNKEIINGGAPLSLRAQNFNGSTNPSDDVNATGTFINDSASFDTLLQAFLDYQPIRTPDTIVAPSDLRSHGEMMLYGSQQWGQNAVMINLDDRSFRDVRLNKLVGSSRVDDTGSRADNPLRTMLGATQLAWLKEQLLAAKAANTTWKFINISDPIDQIGAIGSGDDSGKSWIGGYRAERNEILKFIADNSITNVVFMACDDHQARINEVLYSPSGDLANQSSYVTVPGVISVVDGPLGAGGPDAVTDHSFANSNALAEALAAKQVAAGVDPIGLEKSYSGLSDIWREGDSSAASSPKPVDFYSADTFNYSVLDVSPEGILTVTIRGINSFAANSTPSPNAGNQPRDLLRFSIDGVNDVPSDLVFANGIHSLPEDAITTPSIKLADITIVDDTLGTNVLSLSGADASLFELVGQSLYLKAGTSLNYESGHVSYDVNVSVADLSVLGSSPVSKPYSLQVANVNEAPNSLSLSSLRFNENIAANSIVASLSATDPDQPATPQSFTYSLASGYADNLSFYVSGQGLYIATSPDFERKSFYDVRLLVADQGGLSFQRDIRLSVNDLPDTQTYAVSQSSTSILEGQSVNFGLITTNVPTSTPIYWAISGSGITPADFADGLLTGSGMVGADGRFSLIRTASSDAIADSDENFLVTFYSDAAHTTTLATSTNVQIKEPNVGTPTDGADVIIGTGAAETISGVPNGSTAFGSNSIDKLIGGGGNDLFVLGSSSHRFYDSDGSKGLAIITDFTIGQDRIQLKGAIGDYMLSSGRYNAISGTFVSVASNGDPLGFLQGLRPTGVNPVNLADLNQFTFV